MRKPVLILAVLVLGAAGCGSGDRSVRAGGSAPARSPEASSTPVPGTIQLDEAVKNLKLPIIYEVTGSAKADITYVFGFAPPVQLKRASTPWTWRAPNSDSLVTLKARTTSTNKKATITCRIKLGDDIILVEDTARGPHALADCS